MGDSCFTLDSDGGSKLLQTERTLGKPVRLVYRDNTSNKNEWYGCYLCPFRKDTSNEDSGVGCRQLRESAAARQVAGRFGSPASTVRAIDKRYLERWVQGRKKPVMRQMGVDEIYLGKSQKFLTVVCDLETGEPLWFGRERKKETLDEFFRNELSALRRGRAGSGLRGHVGTVRDQHSGVGAAMPDRLRQVPRHAACQSGSR